MCPRFPLRGIRKILFFWPSPLPLFVLPDPLLLFSKITSHINSVHSSLCLRLCFQANLAHITCNTHNPSPECQPLVDFILTILQLFLMAFRNKYKCNNTPYKAIICKCYCWQSCGSLEKRAISTGCHGQRKLNQI